MLTFCDFQGVLFVRFQKSVDIFSGTYCTFLQTLAVSVRRKRLGLLSRGLLDRVKMPDLIELLKPRREFWNLSGTLLITRLTARILSQAIAISSVHWKISW